MSKIIYLINTPSLPTPGTHYHTTNKFCSGFKYYGYEVSELKSDEEILNVVDSEDSIFMISNHGLMYNGYNPEILRIFEPRQKSKFILWAFHYIQRDLGKIPYIKNYIITGPHFRAEPKSPEALSYWVLQEGFGKKYLELSFSSYFPVEQVGTFERNEIYDAQFVGYGYKKEWCSAVKNGFIRDTSTWSSQISEKERLDSFLQSYCALGLHSNENAMDSCIVERVFEGLALGCVVLSDNPMAEQATNGIVEYISNIEELLEKIEYFKTNTEIRNEKQRLGYEYIKNIGSYKHQAEKFLNRFKELYGN